jgi:hypothetical protein
VPRTSSTHRPQSIFFNPRTPSNNTFMGSIMAANKYARNLRQRYLDFRAVDQQRNGLIEELLERLETLEEEYEIAVLDKARESDYCREGQRRERDLQADIRRYKSMLVSGIQYLEPRCMRARSKTLCMTCSPNRDFHVSGPPGKGVLMLTSLPLQFRIKTLSYWYLSMVTE